MRIKIIKTGEVVEYDAGYAVRLVEQGKAVPATDEKPREKKKGEK